MNKQMLTMVELVILIVVLFLFMVMIMPHTGRAREPARRANCAGNLKQMGVAILMYSGDYSGYFPPTSEGNNLEPLNTLGYLKDSRVYGCPSTVSIGNRASDSNYWYVGAGLMDDNSNASVEPLVFDMFGNHGGPDNEWMNVLFIDGHVEGGKPGKGLPFINDDAVITPAKGGGT